MINNHRAPAAIVPIRSLEELFRFLDWPLPPQLEDVARTYSLYIPQRLAQKIKSQGPDGPLAREFVPDLRELGAEQDQEGLNDPIGDKAFNRAPQLVHRYPSRALFTPTSVCPVHCRYCFRKNELSPKDELFQGEFSQTLSYLQSHPEISEIIFTGGDPLTLSNEKIQKYLSAFAEISSIKDVRFHSRWPVISPHRIDDGFRSIIKEAAKKFRTVTLAIHINHASELDSEINEAITSLATLPLQLLSQTVLLKGINDSTEGLLELFDALIDLKVRPYYLHHPDRVKGGMHFYLSLEEGRRLYASLRKALPGWALPHYVIDVPGGHGKVTAYNPESNTYSGKLLSLEGVPQSVLEPEFLKR